MVVVGGSIGLKDNDSGVDRHMDVQLDPVSATVHAWLTSCMRAQLCQIRTYK